MFECVREWVGVMGDDVGEKAQSDVAKLRDARQRRVAIVQRSRRRESWPRSIALLTSMSASSKPGHRHPRSARK
jgi:hypothetical protein